MTTQTRPAVADILAKLPAVCAHVLEPEHKPIFIKRGERGYYDAPTLLRIAASPGEGSTADPVEVSVNLWNMMRGITKRQVECMVIGSMCGWDVPGADVDYRDEADAHA